MNNLKIIRVFIGSPGGLEKEREAAHEVVNEVNRNHSEHWGCQFKLLGWEDTIPGYQRPQSKINEDLDKCQYFLGVLWNRWGSKPSTDDNGYTSGFHEEYSRAVQRIKSNQMQDLAIYFKKVDVTPGMVPGTQYQSVLDFKQECINDKSVYFNEFESLQGFKGCVRDKLNEIGWRETNVSEINLNEKSVTEVAQGTSQQSDISTDSGNRLIALETRGFISEIVDRPSTLELTEHFEIARFRLISTIVNRGGNDRSYLGNHDANLIFQHLRHHSLPLQEVRGLIRCGIYGFSYQNVPLWVWLSKGANDGALFDEVKYLSVFGDKNEMKNAIRILQLAKQPIPQIDNIFDRKQTLDIWLANENEDVVFEAAIFYLSTTAQSEDISLIQNSPSSRSEQRQIKIEAAIVGILARKNVGEALNYLVAKEVDKIEDDVVIELFKKPQLTSSDTLKLCLSSKIDNVRLQSARLLFNRDEITNEVAKILLSDSNHEIRLLAAETFQKQGQPLDDDVLRKALMINHRFSFIGSSDQDATYYDSFLLNRLLELNLSELKEQVAKGSVFIDKELSALYSKFRARVQNEIRSNLQDRFESFFAEAIKRDKIAGQLDEETESKIKGLELYLRKKYCFHALHALCKLEIADDLLLVRKTLDEIEIDNSESILNYLSRFGDFSDIERIMKLSKNISSHASLISMNTIQFPLETAKAVLALGKHCSADMLALELESEVRKNLVKLIPKRVIVDLTDEVLTRELNRGDDEYRRIISLRCVNSLSKKRVTLLLDQYVNNNGHRYYNSVHWLDLGASLNQRYANTIAQRALRYL